MNKIRIITDSHSGITKEQAKKMNIDVLPMPFTIDGKDYEEGVTLSRSDFLSNLISDADVHTSQPSPATITSAWDEALKSYGQIVYIPISSGLSGSCSAATSLSQIEAYKDRVYVVDNGRVAVPQRRSVMDAVELMSEGYSAIQIKEILETARRDMSIYIAVEDLVYLKRGGRISSATAALGTMLNIKPVLRLNTGLLDSLQKCRGIKKAKKVMIEALQNDLNTSFKSQYDKGEVFLLAASSASVEDAEKWVEEIKEAFPGMDVLYDDLPLAITCHIGPNGFGIGFSCRPSRP